ncbi:MULTISPECIES: hypothetical protein [Clostridium]|uniref:Uncharacterized protein n=1 Tax=Clostridium butyricum TaxID=1492 RepID=A0AAP9UE71_CLOBU|nr:MULTISPECIES: hypothetical protein [Clostridium]MBS4839817.1 hypothetical protein [Clostridium sp.]MBZ5744603.1 hypothetical protein [Clostridium butyricum]MDB2161455.1 hypothetical protein [Clostridium butyricum]MDU1400970.1 hypothetical protein [Clostridium sp.]MDU4926419.1 hypothetical protein [Clostridium sp.]
MSKKKGTNKKREKNTCEEDLYSKYDNSGTQENLNNEKDEYENKEKSQNNDQYNNIDFENMNEDDKYLLQLLYLQQFANFITLTSDSIFINSTSQGIQLLLEKISASNDKENNNNNNENNSGINNTTNLQNNPDELALQAVYGFFTSRLISTYIAFETYNIRVKQKAEGTYKYSLQPSRDINISSILGIVALCYALKASVAIVQRNNIQPILGI